MNHCYFIVSVAIIIPIVANVIADRALLAAGWLMSMPSMRFLQSSKFKETGSLEYVDGRKSRGGNPKWDETGMEKTIEILKRHITTLLSVILTGMILMPKVVGRGFRKGVKTTLPLIGLTIAVCLANELGALLMRRKKDSRAFRLTTGLILWAAAPPVVLAVTQYIVRYSWRLLPEYLWINLALLFLCLIPVTALCGSYKWSVILYAASLTLIVLVSYYVHRFRGKPLTIFDILGARTAADVVSGYVIKLHVKPTICLQWLLLFLSLEIQLQTIRLPGSARARLVRLGIASVTLLCLWLFCKTFLWTPKWMQGGDDWNLRNTYSEKGFYPKFISGLGYLRMPEPEGYSTETVLAIAERYNEEPGTVRNSEEMLSEQYEEKENSEQNHNEPASKQVLKETITTPKNIIVVMNESFADLEMFGEINADTEILPNLHALQSKDGIYVQKGAVYVHAFGGGTANSEYEMLTGNSLQFLAKDVIAYEVYCHDPEYGLVTTLKAQDYDTVAIHPGSAHAWSRNLVYPEMGFDRIIFKDDWNEEQEYETIRGFITDRETYQKIQQVYEERDPDKGLFVFCVTIQNHGGYSAETAEGYEPDVHLNYDKNYPETEMYLSLLKESDRALQEDLLNYFADVSEPTMIVFFGDHQVVPDGDSFYRDVLAPRAAASGEIAVAQNRYKTPVVIWTNYDPGAQSRQLMEAENLEMSTNFLGEYVLELGGFEMPAYDKLLMQLRGQLPVMSVGASMFPDGTWVSAEALDQIEGTAGPTAEEPDQAEGTVDTSMVTEGNTSPALATLLGDYRILAYNNSIDWRSKISEAFTIPAA